MLLRLSLQGVGNGAESGAGSTDWPNLLDGLAGWLLCVMDGFKLRTSTGKIQLNLPPVNSQVTIRPIKKLKKTTK